MLVFFATEVNSFIVLEHGKEPNLTCQPLANMKGTDDIGRQK